MANLLQQFRDSGDKIVNIHHHALDPDDPFHPDSAGAKVQAFAAPIEGEDVVIKHVASAFVGTSLEANLRSAESTARSAGNLGFETIYISDAVWAYAATGPDDTEHRAKQIHSMTLCNLQGEFASVLSAAQLLK